MSVVSAAEKVAKYEWLPEQAASAGLAGDESATPRVVLPVTWTRLPRPTANEKVFTKTYTLELEKFNIRNDGTEAVATTAGINAALQHAKAQGFNRILFPAGTYLIDEKVGVLIDLKDAIIDLNGSTLQMNTNGLPQYSMVNIVDGASNLRLTNGTLRGDRDTHDYTTIKDTHEHCSLLTFHSGQGLEADRLTITNAPGFAVVSRPTGQRSRPELLAMLFHNVNIKDLEQGALSADGQEQPSTEKTRTKKFYDVSRTGGAFEFGYSPGYMGFPFIKDRNYQVLFYDADQKFLRKQSAFQFRKVELPGEAKFIKLEFNQPEVSLVPAHAGAAAEGYCGRISNFRPPRDVHFHHNKITNNRALGMAYCGGQRWVIEENYWEGNGGQAPSYAIDFEDGWDLMQDVVVRKNVFRKNHHDLVVCAGSELLFEENDFERTVFFYGRTYNYTVRNNIFRNASVGFNTRSGVLDISGNTYENLTSLAVHFDGKGVADGFVRRPGTQVRTPAIALKNEKLSNVKSVTGTYVKFLGGTLDKVRLVAGKETVLVQLDNVTSKDSRLVYDAGESPVLRQVQGTVGTLPEEGPGLSRRRDTPLK